MALEDQPACSIKSGCLCLECLKSEAIAHEYVSQRHKKRRLELKWATPALQQTLITGLHSPCAAEHWEIGLFSTLLADADPKRRMERSNQVLRLRARMQFIAMSEATAFFTTPHSATVATPPPPPLPQSGAP